MPAPDTTKLQINYKLADGTLVNAYALNAGELQAQLESIESLAQQIIKVGATLNGKGPVPIFGQGQNHSSQFSGSAVPSLQSPLNGSAVAAVQSQLGGEVISVTTTPAAPITDARHCKHGERQYRESKPGAPKPWKGYFCPSPKGTPDQCEPNFVRG
jgi:hypothetical protein